MDTFICGKCGYLAFGQAPDTCPVCGALKQAFELDNNAIKKPADPKNLSELEKKHIPAIKINRQCGLVGPGCVDVHIKIGEVLHVMEAKHYIMYIDLYLDNAFISRYHLTADKINPVLGIHLKAENGKLLALENCNIHGRWVAQADI
jgi:superoxide reductase